MFHTISDFSEPRYPGDPQEHNDMPLCEHHTYVDEPNYEMCKNCGANCSDRIEE